jgi:hypothetical protein
MWVNIFVTPTSSKKMARKVISKGEIIILIILGFAILTFALQKCGAKVINTSEDSEIIQRPHQ